MEIKDKEQIEDVEIDTVDQYHDNKETLVVRIGDKTGKSTLNKFDVFFIRIWAFICSIILKISNVICSGIKLVIKRDVPKRYVVSSVALLVVILLLILFTSPFKTKVVEEKILNIYPNNLIAVERNVGTDLNGVPIYKWGYANSKGEVKIECKYDAAFDFKYGVAFVKVSEERAGSTYVYWKLIDKKGKNVGEQQFVQAGNTIPVTQFSESNKLARVLLGGRWGYVNTKGKIAIGANYEEAGDFIDGIARVGVGGSTFYFINEKGKQVSINFDEARDLVNGYAAVCTAGIWGFINNKGEIVITPSYNAVSDFYCGYAAIKSGNSYGVIDVKGNQVVKPGLFYSLNILDYFNIEQD